MTAKSRSSVFESKCHLPTCLPQKVKASQFTLFLLMLKIKQGSLECRCLWSFGLTRRGIELDPTVLVADAQFTWPKLIFGFVFDYATLDFYAFCKWSKQNQTEFEKNIGRQDRLLVNRTERIGTGKWLRTVQNIFFFEKKDYFKPYAWNNGLQKLYKIFVNRF